MGIFSKLFNKNSNTIKPNATNNYYVDSASNERFYMVISDVFTITGRGTVVTGKVESGEIHVGDIVKISERNQAEVAGIELFRKTLDVAKTGDQCGILLKNVTKNDVHQGDYLTK